MTIPATPTNPQGLYRPVSSASSTYSHASSFGNPHNIYPDKDSLSLVHNFSRKRHKSRSSSLSSQSMGSTSSAMLLARDMTSRMTNMKLEPTVEETEVLSPSAAFSTPPISHLNHGTTFRRKAPTPPSLCPVSTKSTRELNPALPSSLQRRSIRPRTLIHNVSRGGTHCSPTNSPHRAVKPPRSRSRSHTHAIITAAQPLTKQHPPNAFQTKLGLHTQPLTPSKHPVSQRARPRARHKGQRTSHWPLQSLLSIAFRPQACCTQRVNGHRGLLSCVCC